MSINLIFQNVAVSFERVINFFDLKDEEDSNISIKSTDVFGNIKFNEVSFSYPTNDKMILNRVCLEFNKNSLSVIVGINGCGKSTLFSLLERFYLVDTGEITINNNNINNIDLKYLRENIGIVQQNPTILEGTLRENLEYGYSVQDNTLDEICEKVGLKDFVDGLENRYDTMIENVSGGQLQKIAIARVLIKDAPILLLDEITSDLDGKSEYQIINLFNYISNNKTIIMISHRISSIINIPNIYVLEQGKLIGKGNHKELLASCDLYRALIASQDKSEGIY